MCDVRSHTCPRCGAAHDFLAGVVAHSEEAGAETWTSSYSGGFRLTADVSHARRTEHLAAATRSPFGWNPALPMWHRRLR